jgi:hypothetical protein
MKRLSRPDFQLYLLTLLLLAAGITVICIAAENRAEIIELLSLPAAVGFFIVVEAVIYTFTIHFFINIVVGFAAGKKTGSQQA